MLFDVSMPIHKVRKTPVNLALLHIGISNQASSVGNNVNLSYPRICFLALTSRLFDVQVRAAWSIRSNISFVDGAFRFASETRAWKWFTVFSICRISSERRAWFRKGAKMSRFRSKAYTSWVLFLSRWVRMELIISSTSESMSSYTVISCIETA